MKYNPRTQKPLSPVTTFKEAPMFGLPLAGIREGRTSTQELPNLSEAVIIDMLLACALHTGQTRAEVEVIVRRDMGVSPWERQADQAVRP